jgi:SET domain-containing protein
MSLERSETLGGAADDSMVARRGFMHTLDLRKSQVDPHGRGVFPTQRIPKHTYIGSFQGKRLSPEEADARGSHSMFFEVRDREGRVACVIDASNTGDENKLKFVNTITREQRKAGKRYNTCFRNDRAGK